MKPTINCTEFGSITISDEQYPYDVVIRLSGEVQKRKKKLSKAKYGTSHRVSLEEAQRIFESGAKLLIIGTGQTGYVELSSEASKFFERNACATQLLPTPQALIIWNEAKGSVIGMFHVTC